MKSLLTSLLLLTSVSAQSQIYPTYGTEIDVTIVGLTFDAMEPFISTDGDVLFFNNLNDGINTKLYYSTKINDSTFNFIGEVNGANQLTPPHLDAVADMDFANNFYWTSTRDYPAQLNNLFHGTYNSGNVTSIGRVYGDFNKNIPGWLVMDHGISYDGQYLYYNNARFDGGNCQGPCETEMGIAVKVNDSTFNKMLPSDGMLQNINDTNYIYYAPCISDDNLELYYTRYLKDTITVNTLFEICVAVRSSSANNFSVPSVLFSETIGDLIEAVTLTTDKQVMYYHRKIPGSHKIVMRYRDGTLSTNLLSETASSIAIYPNPTNGIISVKPASSYHEIKLSILTLLGDEVMEVSNQTEIDIASLPSGTYFIKIELDGREEVKKILKID